jgi:pimeloyl-ACP methyl ester carboxylesterase
MESSAGAFRRSSFNYAGLNFSYLDSEGDGDVLVALHAHWMEGITFAPLADALAPTFRVVAPDQRGHGHSDHATSYTRDDYLGDLAALLDHLHLTKPFVLLGNSLGGVNAYQYAARNPDPVRGLIIEDIGVEIADDITIVPTWTGNFRTREELAERIGPRLSPYLEPSFRETRQGWRLAFDPQETVESQTNIKGDHWKDWLGSSCPALLIRGRESRVTKQEHLEEMAARRPDTKLEVLDGGHVIHQSHPELFARTVKAFLQQL